MPKLLATYHSYEYSLFEFRIVVDSVLFVYVQLSLSSIPYSFLPQILFYDFHEKPQSSWRSGMGKVHIGILSFALLQAFSVCIHIQAQKTSNLEFKRFLINHTSIHELKNCWWIGFFQFFNFYLSAKYHENDMYLEISEILYFL